METVIVCFATAKTYSDYPTWHQRHWGRPKGGIRCTYRYYFSAVLKAFSISNIFRLSPLPL